MVKKNNVNSTKNLMKQLGVFSFLGSGKTMFSGMKFNLGVGDIASVTGTPKLGKGHAPPAKFAQLSDGSKLTLIGKNKGLIVK